MNQSRELDHRNFSKKGKRAFMKPVSLSVLGVNFKSWLTQLDDMKEKLENLRAGLEGHKILVIICDKKLEQLQHAKKTLIFRVLLSNLLVVKKPLFKVVDH